jgi:hypothetical protein
MERVSDHISLLPSLMICRLAVCTNRSRLKLAEDAADHQWHAGRAFEEMTRQIFGLGC